MIVGDPQAVEVVLKDGTGTVVDAADLPLLRGYRWKLQGSRPDNLYVVASVFNGRCATTLRLHRHLLGAKPGEIVDHINGDRTDNRRSNLRITDAAGNAQNAGKRGTGTASRFKGVFRSPKRNVGTPWTASIRAQGKAHRVGMYKTEIEAARAYDEAARRLHGQFAKTNADLCLY